MLREQVSLLPPAHTRELLRTLKQLYSGLYALSDTGPIEALDTVAYPAAPLPAGELIDGDIDVSMLAFPDAQLAAIAFTSGSTGAPSPHPKTWRGLTRGATAEAQSLGMLDDSAITLVGTVPAQHMYGLESTVLLALHNGLVLDAGRPFYPADIRDALEHAAGNGVLVTTPVHLRALLADATALPNLRLILCATAPLSPKLAVQAEARYHAPLYEVYGFTEAGMVATRRTTQGLEWHPLPSVQLRKADDASVWFSGGHVPAEVCATDLLEITPTGTFILQGRNADLVNVAGKRTSIAYLNHQLINIDGVRDGVFFMPDERAEGVTRLIAFVVAPQMSRQDVLAELRKRIDPVFLPRPLYRVESLPRNATGKLPRDALADLALQSTESAE